MPAGERPVAANIEEMLERLPGAAVLVAAGGRFLSGNASACELLKRGPSELSGLAATDVVAPGFDHEAARTQLRTRGELSGEANLVRPDGSLVPIEFRARLGFEPGSDAVLALLSDLSERKRVERRLRQSEERFVSAFNASPAPTNIRALESGTFLEVNPAFLELTGFWRSDVLGRSADQIGLWDQPLDLHRMLDELRSGKPMSRTRAGIHRKDGSVVECGVAMRLMDLQGAAHVIGVYTHLAAF